jgi:hypothetical protein
MQPVLPDPVTTPQSSLSIQTEVYIGVNGLRKAQGRSVTLFLGSTATDRNAVIPASGGSLTVSEQITAFQAISSGPLSLVVNSKTINMNTMLVFDEPITSGGLVFTNHGSAIVQLHLTYLNP